MQIASQLEIHRKAPVDSVTGDGGPEGIMSRILRKSWEVQKCKLNS